VAQDLRDISEQLCRVSPELSLPLKPNR